MLYNNNFFKYSLSIFSILAIIFLIGKMGFLIVLFKQIFKLIFIPILISILFYYILRPIIILFSKIRVKKSFSSAIVVLGILSIIILALVYGGSSVKDFFDTSFYKLLQQFKQGLEVLNKKLGSIVPTVELEREINSTINNVVNSIETNFTEIFSKIANVGSQIVIIPFILFYFLKDDRELVGNFIKIIPYKYKNKTKNLLLEIDKTLSIYITGQLTVAIIIGILMYIGFRIIKIPNALLLAVCAMVTNIIPFLGPFLGAFPAVLTALTIDVWMIAKVIVVSIIVQQLEGNLITPNILGNKLSIHPLTILLLVLIFISLFGFIGAFIAIPLYAVLKVILKNIDRLYKLNSIKTKKE